MAQVKLKFIYIFLLFSVFSFSQNEAIPVVTNVKDTLLHQKKYLETDSVLSGNYQTDHVIYDRTFPPGYKHKYRSSDFSYDTVKSREAFWSKVKRKINHFLESVFGKFDPEAQFQFTRIVLWIIGLAAFAVILYYVISYFSNRSGNFWFGKKNTKMEIKATSIIENIHEINFAEEILKFEQQKNFRMAVRYQFLNILKKMADRKIIEWNPQKTNKDYLAETENGIQKSAFADLVRIFDYVWYGEFEIDQNGYRAFKEKFANFRI